MKTASDPFKEWWSTGWVPPEELKDPANFPLSIDTPIGAITTEGTRRNIRTIIEYVEGWLSGRGAKGIDSMEGREGKRPALMEDLATARISVGQVSQRIIHSAVGQDIKNYTDMDFRSLGSYTREDLANIALEPEAF